MPPDDHANIDGAEIANFEALSKEWWDRSGRLKALHDINALRVGYIRRQVAPARKKVLDAGCGGGILAEALAGLGARVTGIDMGAAALAAARAHRDLGAMVIDYRRTSVEALAVKQPRSFDLVTCMELLEHVPRPQSVVRACSRLCRPGGHIVFATLNRNLKSFLFAIVGAEYVLRLVPRGTHTYSRFVKPAELQSWARDSGLACRDLTGLHYNPFLRRYGLGGNAHVNYLMHFERIGEC